MSKTIKTHIGFMGGRRVDIGEMANDAKSREELQNLLGLMTEIESRNRRQETIESNAPDEEINEDESVNAPVSSMNDTPPKRPHGSKAEGVRGP